MSAQAAAGHPQSHKNKDSLEPSNATTDLSAVEADIVHWILQKKNGACEVHEVLTKFLQSVSVEQFFDQARASSNLLINRHQSSPLKSIVKAYSTRAKLCFQYNMNGKCPSPNCRYLHLCSLRLQQNKCRCAEFRDCLMSDHNTRVIKLRSLQHFSMHELILICKNSFLTVCLSYNSTSGCMNETTYEFCPFIHICQQFVHGQCRETNCRRGHSLNHSPGNKTMIEKLVFDIKSPNFEKIIVRCLLVPSIRYLVITALIDNGDKSGLSLTQLGKATGINEESVLLEALHGLQPLILIESKSVFLKMNEFQTCFFHNSLLNCDPRSCPMFHVCRSFLMHGTRHPIPCPLNHDLEEPRISQLFEQRMRIHLSLQQRLQILKMSALRLCQTHKSGTCRKPTCNELHLCQGFITETSEIDHNEKVLNRHGFCNLNLKDPNVLAKMVVVGSNEAKTEPQQKQPKSQSKANPAPATGKKTNKNSKCEPSISGSQGNTTEKNEPQQRQPKSKNKAKLAAKEVQAEPMVRTEHYLWRWTQEDGSWTMYGLEDEEIQQDLIEARYQDYLNGESLGIVVFEINQMFYEINFSMMSQKNLSTEELRYVERITISPSTLSKKQKRMLSMITFKKKNLPKVLPSWSPMNTQNELASDIIALKPDSSEFREVEQDFYATMSETTFQIFRVYRVQNLNQWKSYVKKKDEMQKRLDCDFREECLFHGTPDFGSVCCICNQSFDCRLSGRHGMLYGDGAYFSKSAVYSNGYTTASHNNCHKYMFRASVLVGRFAKGEKGMRRPPALGDKHKLLYDSVVDHPNSPTIFVIFQNDQAYPTHLIEYKENVAVMSTRSPPPQIPNYPEVPTHSQGGIQPSAEPYAHSTMNSSYPQSGHAQRNIQYSDAPSKAEFSNLPNTQPDVAMFHPSNFPTFPVVQATNYSHPSQSAQPTNFSISLVVSATNNNHPPPSAEFQSDVQHVSASSDRPSQKETNPDEKTREVTPVTKPKKAKCSLM